MPVPSGSSRGYFTMRLRSVFRIWVSVVLACALGGASTVARGIGRSHAGRLRIRRLSTLRGSHDLSTLRQARPELGNLFRDVRREPGAADELTRIAKDAGMWPPGVPTFVRGSAVLVGFGDDAAGRSQLDQFIDQGTIADGAVETSWFGTLIATRLGLPLFTLALGLLDGFNPCAMWVLLFLLSLLVR